MTALEDPETGDGAADVALGTRSRVMRDFVIGMVNRIWDSDGRKDDEGLVQSVQCRPSSRTEGDVAMISCWTGSGESDAAMLYPKGKVAND